MKAILMAILVAVATMTSAAQKRDVEAAMQRFFEPNCKTLSLIVPLNCKKSEALDTAYAWGLKKVNDYAQTEGSSMSMTDANGGIILILSFDDRDVLKAVGLYVRSKSASDAIRTANALRTILDRGWEGYVSEHINGYSIACRDTLWIAEADSKELSPDSYYTVLSVVGVNTK